MPTLTALFWHFVRCGLSEAEAETRLLREIKSGQIVITPPLPPCRLRPMTGDRLLVETVDARLNGDEFRQHIEVRTESLLKPVPLTARQQAAIEAMYADEKPAAVIEPSSQDKGGPRQSRLWDALILPHLDTMIASGHGFANEKAIYDAARKCLDDAGKDMDRRTLTRGLRRNRPDWFRA